MGIKRFVFIISLFLISFFKGNTQPICSVKEYSFIEGFSQSAVTDILQDRNGLIWISSRDGLTRFDGYKFINYKSYPGDGSTMKYSRINWISENSEGDIWCLSQDERAYLFDRESETFIDVLLFVAEADESIVSKIIPLKNGITWIICKNAHFYRIDDRNCKKGEGIETQHIEANEVNNVHLDKEGNEWVLTNKGVVFIGNPKFNSKIPYASIVEDQDNVWLCAQNGHFANYNSTTGKLSEIALPESVMNVYTLSKLKDGSIVLGTDAGLLIYNQTNGNIQQVTVNVNSSTRNEVYSIYEDKYGDLWMSNNNKGVIYYQRSEDQVEVLYSPKNESLNYESPNKFLINEDCQGNLWVIPKEGNLCYFDRETKELKYYFAEFGNIESIISPFIRPYCLDKQGNIWYGNPQSFGKLSFFEKDFTIVRKDKDNLEIRALLLDQNNNLWIGSKGGGLKIIDESQKCLGYITKSGELTNEPHSFPGDVYCLMEDDNGNIWVGTKGKGIYLFEPIGPGKLSFKASNYRFSSADKYSLHSNYVYSIFQDSKKRVWIGSYGGGLNLVEKNEHGEIRFLNNKNLLKALPTEMSGRVRYITETNDQVILACTMDGLISFSSKFEDYRDIEFYQNTRKSSQQGSLSNNDVMYAYCDKSGNIYVLTQNGGINKIISSNLLSNEIQFESYTEKDGLFSDMVLSMIEDKSLGLWVVTKKAILKYNTARSQVLPYGSYRSRQNITYSEGAIALNASGNVVLGTDKGVLGFDQNSLLQPEYVPPIIFTQLSVQGLPYKGAIEGLGTLVLNPKQRNLSIEYAALDFKNPKEIQYAYMLEGIDTDWHYVNFDRTATYINIPHGDYRFSVKSTNSDGVWSENMSSLSIEVKPKFSETIWAWLLYAMLFVATTFVVIYVVFTIYRLRHKVEMEHKLSNAKLAFFTNASHELRTPLTLISSPVSEILENENLSKTAKAHLSIVKRNIERMLHLVNQILDLRKIQNNKMNLFVEEVDIVQFIPEIMLSFKLEASRKNISFDFICREDQLNLWLDKDKFEKIIFNLLSNAFKHTPSGKSISILAKEIQDTVEISVIDTGNGIEEQKMNTLFQRFDTLASKDVSHLSSGIGLSMVKELVELHQGTIKVNSKVNSGSTFIVSLMKGANHFEGNHNTTIIDSENKHKNSQLSLKDSLTDTYLIDVERNNFKNGSENSKLQVNLNEENTSPDSAKTKKSTILIVEDNQELQEYLYSTLNIEYNVLAAQNGKDGLNSASKYMPDLILSDIMMPVMDGIQMVKAIKNDKIICHIPIVLLSAKSCLGDRISGLEEGIDDYITKPFSSAYLKARIRSLIRQREELQKWYMSLLVVGPKETSYEKLNPSIPKFTSQDELFIKQLMQIMEENMDNTSFSVNDFADNMSMSRTVFYKKVKSMLGISPVDFIKDIRVKRAVQLIDSGITSLTEVAYKCGFNDPNYFAKCFKKQTGITPSEYKRTKS